MITKTKSAKNKKKRTVSKTRLGVTNYGEETLRNKLLAFLRARPKIQYTAGTIGKLPPFDEYNTVSIQNTLRSLADGCRLRHRQNPGAERFNRKMYWYEPKAEEGK